MLVIYTNKISNLQQHCNILYNDTISLKCPKLTLEEAMVSENWQAFVHWSGIFPDIMIARTPINAGSIAKQQQADL